MLLALLFTIDANAACKVFVPVKEFIVAGYPIRFEFTSMFDRKGYTEVFTLDEADHVLKVEGIEDDSHALHHAVAKLSFDRIQVVEAKSCFTQFCGVSDYGKVFNKAYRQLSKELPACK